MLPFGRDSEDVWSRFVQELVIWPKEVTLVSRTQPSGPLCLWQCFFLAIYRYLEYQTYGISNTKHQEQNIASMLIGVLHEIMEFLQPRTKQNFLKFAYISTAWGMLTFDIVCISWFFLYTYRNLVWNLEKCYSRIGD